MPRVYGNAPGSPSAAAGSRSSTSFGPYTPLIGAPDSDLRLIPSAYGGEGGRFPVSCATPALPLRGERGRFAPRPRRNPGPAIAKFQSHRGTRPAMTELRREL